ncbi:MAG: hypothetical protein HHJ11_09060 [Phycicoccus sp.]|nr:hypothetical protein [Phycicoccus sp.]NMM34579.1 hypothetical protein [Phycicoccus sp.]
MSTLIAPRKPAGSSPDDDQTGVRALLSGLPEPDPMPAYLVERISASLAAEQAQRAVLASDASVTPLLATRRRPRRVLFSLAGAAAAVVLIGVLGTNLVRDNSAGGVTSAASSRLDSAPREAGGLVPPSSSDKSVSGDTLAPASIRIRVSTVRYTQDAFVAQARKLRDIAFASPQPMATNSSDVGLIGTTGGLISCLNAIGAGGAQLVEADLAFYEGQPAVVIVATTNGVPTAYAVGRGCSQNDASLLHQGVALP